MKQFKNIVMLAGICIILASCKKEVPSLFNMYDVTLDLDFGSKVQNTEGQIDISTTDSVIINYTLTSPSADMYGVGVFKNGASGPTVTSFKAARTYTGVLKLYGKDLGIGSTTYRIWGVDQKGVYLGDGYKQISVNVVNDIEYITNRYVYLPVLSEDAGKLESFVSLTGVAAGKTYTYNAGKEASAEVDFGLCRRRVDTTVKVKVLRPDASAADKEKDTLVSYFPLIFYSPDASPDPNITAGYDMAAWTTRKKTVFGGVETGATPQLFKDKFNTVGKIVAESEKRTFTQSEVRLTSWANREVIYLNKDLSNKFIYLKTQEGKYVILLLNVSKMDGKGIYINISWKKQP